MTLDATALLTQDELLSALGMDRYNMSINMLAIYNGSSGATAATVSKTGNVLTLTVTGGANAGTETLTLTDADKDTMSELVTAIEALSKGWVVNRLCVAAMPSTDLNNVSVSCLAAANETILVGFNSLLIDETINAVSAFATKFCRRTFLSSVPLTEYHDATPDNYLKLDSFPIVAITSVDSWDWTLDASSDSLTNHDDYESNDDKGMLYNPNGWDNGRGTKAWKVVYTAGYTAATMPEDLKQGIKDLCSYIYFKRSKQGIKSERIGAYSVAYSEGSGAKISGITIPAEMINFLLPYRKLDA